jgi:hypothetical protein
MIPLLKAVFALKNLFNFYVMHWSGRGLDQIPYYQLRTVKYLINALSNKDAASAVITLIFEQEQTRSCSRILILYNTVRS